MLKRTSRAYLAGVALGKALVEMVNLMYQENTARNFFSGVLSELGKSKRHFGKKRTPKSSKVVQRSTSNQQPQPVICPNCKGVGGFARNKSGNKDNCTNCGGTGQTSGRA